MNFFFGYGKMLTDVNLNYANWFWHRIDRVLLHSVISIKVDLVALDLSVKKFLAILFGKQLINVC